MPDLHFPFWLLYSLKIIYTQNSTLCAILSLGILL